MFCKLFVWVGLGLFVLLSASDWMLTFALLNLQPEAIESNPLASACLERYGWGGLALYKIGGVIAFLGASVLLVRRRPVIAAGVVVFGCTVLLSVTTYTHGLICEAKREACEKALNRAPIDPSRGSHAGTELSTTEHCGLGLRNVPGSVFADVAE